MLFRKYESPPRFQVRMNPSSLSHPPPYQLYTKRRSVINNAFAALAGDSIRPLFPFPLMALSLLSPSRRGISVASQAFMWEVALLVAMGSLIKEDRPRA